MEGLPYVLSRSRTRVAVRVTCLLVWMENQISRRAERVVAKARAGRQPN